MSTPSEKCASAEEGDTISSSGGHSAQESSARPGQPGRLDRATPPISSGASAGEEEPPVCAECGERHSKRKQVPKQYVAPERESKCAKRLVLEIEVPGFYVDDYSGSPEELAEEVEVAMQLATEQVSLTFVHHEGDSPQLFVKPMEGRIIGFEVRRVG